MPENADVSKESTIDNDGAAQSQRNVTPGKPVNNKLVRARQQLRILRLKYNNSERRRTCLEKSLSALFNKDQLQMLQNSSRKITKWSEDSIKNGLQYRFTMGTHAYNTLRKEGMPLPSIRTLAERLQGINFAPGVQHKIIDALREKVATLSDKERTVVLLLDEMQLRQTVEYDPSLKRMTGMVTLPNGLKKEATHALVTMIRCITTPWKQVISKVSKTHVIHYTANPVQPERRLYILADPPHILKSKRNNLLKYVFNVNECTAFAAEAVPQPAECLECCSDSDVVNNVAIDDMRIVKLNHSVDVKHIKTVIDVQENSELRIAHKLKNIHVNPEQHQKMNVHLTFQLLSDDTAAAIKTFIALGHLPSEANDTASFVQLVNSWYRIMSVRHKGDALERRWKDDFRNIHMT